MIGAIAGDIIGAPYEFNQIKTKDFPLFGNQSDFTDDSVLTIATADCILNKKPYAETYKLYTRKYPGRGYGGNFSSWATSTSLEPYNSWGNGSAMRVSPVGFAFDTMEKTLTEAKKSAEVTHNHPEGIKGAQATAAAIFIARQDGLGRDGRDKIRNFIEAEFSYSLSESVDEIRKWYYFNESCQKTVPQAIQSFLESDSFEDAIRNAVSLGGDSDTVANIAGGIAEAGYGVPDDIRKKVKEYLPPELIEVIGAFYERFMF